MSSTYESRSSLIGAPAGSPLDPGRVGELPDCIDTIRRVETLVNEHIETLETLRQKEIPEIFDDTRVLQDRSSPWYGFTAGRIDKRLKWFHDTLVPILSRDLTNVAYVLHEFSEFWDTEIRAGISNTGKLHITNIHRVWRAVQMSLEKKSPTGPYRVGEITECKSHLNRLHAEIESMGSRIEEGWLQPRWIHQIAANWFERNPSVYSLELPKALDNQRSSSELPDIAVMSLGNLDNPDLEHGRREVRIDDERQHSVLRQKELWLVVLCFIAAVTYSIVTHDVQTGFAIAGMLLVSGTVLLGAIMCKSRRTRKMALD